MTVGPGTAAAPGPSFEPFRVFVSHGSADTWIASQFHARIVEIGGIPFLDELHLTKGDDYRTILRAELRRSDELVAIFSPWTVDRPWVWNEIGAAWALEKRIIAVLQGMTLDELIARSQGASVLEDRNVLTLNEADRYFSELRSRIRGTDGG